MLSADIGVNKKLKIFALDFLRAPVPLCENGFDFCFGLPGLGLKIYWRVPFNAAFPV